MVLDRTGRETPSVSADRLCELNVKHGAFNASLDIDGAPRQRRCPIKLASIIRAGAIVNPRKVVLVANEVP
jgi:hypothetical protein